MTRISVAMLIMTLSLKLKQDQFCECKANFVTKCVKNIILFTTLEIVNVIVDVRATLSLKLNKTVPSDHSVLFSLYFWKMTVPNDRTIFAIF